jgi:hypothetical protein
LLSVAAVCLMMATSNAAVADEPNILQKTNISQLAAPTTTVIATITKIDAAAGIIVAKDQTGKIWELILGPQSGIDLSQYKVGDTIKANLTNVTTTGNAVMRARISKQELLKLQ